MNTVVMGSLAKATPLDPQHQMYYITGTRRKGLVYMPYSTCSSGMFVVANVIMNIIKIFYVIQLRNC